MLPFVVESAAAAATLGFVAAILPHVFQKVVVRPSTGSLVGLTRHMSDVFWTNHHRRDESEQNNDVPFSSSLLAFLAPRA